MPQIVAGDRAGRSERPRGIEQQAVAERERKTSPQVVVKRNTTGGLRPADFLARRARELIKKRVLCRQKFACRREVPWRVRMHVSLERGKYQEPNLCGERVERERIGVQAEQQSALREKGDARFMGEGGQRTDMHAGRAREKSAERRVVSEKDGEHSLGGIILRFGRGDDSCFRSSRNIHER